MINFLFVFTLSFAGISAPPDSIRLETIQGRSFIIHKVDEKETLYSLSRRYGTHVDEIVKFNAGLDGPLEIGRILKIPYSPSAPQPSGSVHIVKEKETLFSISREYQVSVEDLMKWNNLSDPTLSIGQQLTVRKSTPPSMQHVQEMSKKGVHVVEAKETVFSISRQHGISVEELKGWNNLEGDDLKVGQVLVVIRPVKQENIRRQEVPKEIPPKEEPEIREPPKTITISENVKNTDEISENGLAELIEGTEGNRKYLALHRTAPVGTILKIKNEMNDREVFVRVMGKLPDTALTKNVIIKISKSAFDRLGALDPQFRVQVIYYK